MGSHPINLAVRFLLELAALGAMGTWGFAHGTGMTRYICGIGIPLIAVAFWVTFAVPNDPSRKGTAPVPVAGIWRLMLELSFFGVAVWMLSSLAKPALALSFGAAVVIHYATSRDRIVWLLRAA